MEKGKKVEIPIAAFPFPPNIDVKFSNSSVIESRDFEPK